MTTGVGMPAEAVAPMRGAPFWPALEGVAHTLAYDGEIMGETMSGFPLPAERWTSGTVPTLAMDGGDSPPYQRNSVQALVDILPDARRRTLEGQTHEADPSVLAPVLEEFFVERWCYVSSRLFVSSIVAVLSVVLVPSASAQALDWVNQFGSVEHDTAWSVAITGGAAYVAGETEGTCPARPRTGPSTRS